MLPKSALYTVTGRISIKVPIFKRLKNILGDSRG
jgi:hypothetical protein